MLQQEFQERVNFTVTGDCYREFIEPEYAASKLDKDEWCKQWKKDHGIQRAYSWMAKQVEALKKNNSHMSAAIAASNDKKEIAELKKNLQIISDSLAARNKQISDLCNFIIEQSHTYGSPELRNKAIELMGAKDYLPTSWQTIYAFGRLTETC